MHEASEKAINKERPQRRGYSSDQSKQNRPAPRSNDRPQRTSQKNKPKKQNLQVNKLKNLKTRS